MLQLKKYDSIHHIDPQHWDSILDTDDIFHTWQFIRIVEDGKVENSRFRYLLFYKDGKLIASTDSFCVYYFPRHFYFRCRIGAKDKKRWPGFFNIRILVCGLPASFGQLNLKIVEDNFANEVCSLIATEMKVLGKEWKIRFLSVKEFLEHNKELGGQLLKEGFFLANSIPYMSMEYQVA